jgi:HEAT repeat protein
MMLLTHKVLAVLKNLPFACALFALVLGAWIVILVLTSYFVRGCHFDYGAKRERIAEHLRSLKADFLRDPSRKDLLAEIESAAKSSYRFERDYALSVLGQLGEHATPAIPTIVEGLRNSDSFTSAAAAHALANLGVHAEPAKGDLIAALRGHVSDSTGRYAARALGNIGDSSPDVLSALEFAIKADSEAAEAAQEAYRRLAGEVD